jgi:cytoskeletal protein CcmA (bactofilin family)
MNILWPFLFFSFLVLLFLLPLTPALIEWRRKEDAAPLKVVREYDGNIAYFAASFRRFLDEHLQQSRDTLQPPDEAFNDSLKNGQAYQLVGVDGRPYLSTEEVRAKSVKKIILGLTPLNLPEQIFFESEIYAAQGIASGSRNSFRAILSDADVRLGAGCDVIRWMHCGTSIAIGANSRLYGRVSAEKCIVLQRQTFFDRVQAPTIRFGETGHAPIASCVPLALRKPLLQPEKLLDNAAGRWLVAGDLQVPAESFHRGDLVARGNLEIGRGACIQGSIKSNRNLRLHGDLRIDGAVISAQSMRIGSGCMIKGPIAGEMEVVIESGCIVGSPEHPTTITANDIRIEEGVVVHGAIWARKEGFVAAASKEQPR